MTELNTLHDLIHTPIYSNLYIHVCMHVIYLYFISDDTPGETSRNPSIKNICFEDEINNDEYIYFHSNYSYCENDDIKKNQKRYINTI